MKYRKTPCIVVQIPVVQANRDIDLANVYQPRLGMMEAFKPSIVDCSVCLTILHNFQDEPVVLELVLRIVHGSRNQGLGIYMYHT